MQLCFWCEHSDWGRTRSWFIPKSLWIFLRQEGMGDTIMQRNGHLVICQVRILQCRNDDMNEPVTSIYTLINKYAHSTALLISNSHTDRIHSHCEPCIYLLCLHAVLDWRTFSVRQDLKSGYLKAYGKSIDVKWLQGCKSGNRTHHQDANLLHLFLIGYHSRRRKRKHCQAFGSSNGCKDFRYQAGLGITKPNGQALKMISMSCANFTHNFWIFQLVVVIA